MKRIYHLGVEVNVRLSQEVKVAEEGHGPSGVISPISLPLGIRVSHHFDGRPQFDISARTCRPKVVRVHYFWDLLGRRLLKWSLRVPLSQKVMQTAAAV